MLRKIGRFLPDNNVMLRLAILSLFLIPVSAMPQTQTEDDRAVIEAAGFALLHAPEFRRFTVDKSNRLIIVEKGPEKVGMLSATQIEVDLAPEILDRSLIEALWQRNWAGKGWDSKPFSTLKMKFRAPLLVGKVSKERGLDRTRNAWFQPFAPAYSDDQRLAVVRGWIGPSPHGATGTVLLQRIGSRWTVRWIKIAQYV